MSEVKKAFTIRLRGAVLESLLQAAEKAGHDPTPFIERLVTSGLQDADNLRTEKQLEELRTDLLFELNKGLRLLRSDLITTTEAVLFELRGALSGKALSEGEKEAWEGKVRGWTEALRRRS